MGGHCVSQIKIGQVDPLELGRRLQEARRARGLTQGDAARHLGVARTTITAMEKGIRQVKPQDLIKLADLYGHEVSFFARPLPPTESFLVQFRAVMSQDAPSNLIDAFKALCDNYAFLEQVTGTNPREDIPQYDVQRLPPHRAGEYVAGAERNRLGLGDAPIGDLRALLEEDIGLKVFYLDLPSDTAGLFAYTQVHKGCVAINRQHPAERNRWTMAHEYGHYLTGRFRADVVPYAEQRLTSWAERTAGSFARNLLMPSDGVNRWFDLVYQQHAGRVTPADLLSFSRYFGVSFKTAVQRLEELRRISGGAWDVPDSQGSRVREAEPVFEAPALPERKDKFPRSYILLAITAFARALITEKQLADVLTTDRLGARDEVQRAMEEAGIDDLSRFVEPLPEG